MISTRQPLLYATRALSAYRHQLRRALSTQPLKVHPTSLSAFNIVHASYDKFRPTYFKPAVDALVRNLDLPENAEVVDLASGTGKFTALLKDYGFNLSAVEVSDGMLATFRERLPDIPAYKGSSYDIPVADKSLDALFVAQAFHWFADMTSLHEFHRVLKPTAGKLALIWNFEPEIEINNKWQWEVAQACWAFDLDLPQFRRMNWQDVFQTEEARELFDLPLKNGKMYWSYKIAPEDVFGLWATKSYIVRLDEAEKEKLKAKVDLILKEYASDLVDENGLLEQRLGVYYAWTSNK
ncbi:S-adenosyl-L-methionine-dependent methyltransferase [Lipomyces arxii]|uniref:S-adenosyl-L-methionine-dependent methyltransferase n=1 Tax=Lipomyces arxii TaxID=56418 RepID=UPI0034CFE7DE